MRNLLLRGAPALFVVLWSTGFIGGRAAMPYAEPFLFLAVRFLLAFVIIFALVRLMRRPRLPRHKALHAMVSGALIHGLYLGTLFWALHYGMPAGPAALITCLQPILVAIFAGTILQEEISPRQWFGMGLGLAGAVLVLWPQAGLVDTGVTIATVTACVLALFSISAGTLWQKKFVADVDLLSGTLWQYLGAFLVMIVPAILLEKQAYVLNGELVFAMVWLVFVLSLGAVFLLMVLIKQGEVSKVSSLFFLVPSVTALMAWALFGETMHGLQLTGMVVSSLGVAIATLQISPRLTASR